MKILLRGLNLVVKYEEGEWEQVEAKMKSLGMEKRKSNRIFGSYEGEFYRLNSSYDDEIIKRTVIPYGGYDDINATAYGDSAYEYNGVNCCVFRIVPNESGEVLIPLPKYLTVVDIKKIVQIWSKVYKILLDIITDAEIEIKFKKEEVK